MKILLLTPWYPTEKNPGAGVFIKSQVRALSTMHQVTVISSSVDYAHFAFSSCAVEENSKENIREYRITVKKSIPIFNQLNFLWLLVMSSLKIAREVKPDIIHAHVGYPSAFWAWCLAKMLKVPYVVTEHTRPVNNFRSGAHKALTVFGMKRASAVVAVSKMLADEVTRYINRSVTVVPNIVETERFQISPFPDSEVVQIGFLGTLNKPVKGLDVLLKAAANWKIDFVLHIGGSGVLLPSYEQLAHKLGIANKCIFYGFILPGEVPTFMSRLHFFVCSSRSETFCVALAEAMAAGRPVVSTRCGGPEEFVDDTNGILVQSEDVVSLRKGLEQMTVSWRSYASEKISKGVINRFGANSFVQQMNKVYAGIRSISNQ